MKRKWIWIGLGLFAILLRLIVSKFPQFVEDYYSRALFLGLRKVLDLTRFIPFPFVYLLIVLLVFLLGRGMYKLFADKESFKKRISNALLSLVASLSAITFFFLFLWGFNYARVPIEDQISIEPNPLSKEVLWLALQKQSEFIETLRLDIGVDSIAIQTTDLPLNLEEEIKKNLKATLDKLGYPSQLNPKIQQLRPKGILLRFQTLGVYFPWSGECNLDAGLHPLEVPHVMAHELAHAYGFGDEGTCNFLAYLACTSSDNPIIKYAGHFEYYSTLAINYRKYNLNAYSEELRNLPPAIKADWNDIILTHNQYPDILPKLRRATYDTYLKAQGIEEGIKNYNRVLMLVEAWKNRE